MSNYSKIIKTALNGAGSGAKKIGTGVVDTVKKYPKTASYFGGAAVNGALVENLLQKTMTDLREQGYSDEEIVNYLLSYDVNALKGE